MRIGVSPTPGAWRTSFLAALAGHLLLLAWLILVPSLGLFPPEKEVTEVRLVHLKGGGENIPGWIKPTPAPPDKAKVPDGTPKAAPKKTEPVQKKTPPPAKEKPAPKETAPKETAPDKTKAVEPKTEAPAAEPETTSADTAKPDTTPAAETPAPAVAGTETTGEGVGAKPGPEGPGVGARSDADFPGGDVYLSRIEAEVQRRFNFRGRGTGAVAEYHFFLDKRGEMKDLVLMKSSGIGSLDLAARSALLRAKFPPLPPGFGHDRLGVTYRFFDAK